MSNLTGKVATLAEVGTPEYWVRHIAEPVNFLAGMRAVQKRGKHVFIEVGPSAALTNLGKQCGDASEHLWLSSSTPSRDEDGTTIRKALVEGYTAGLAVSWTGYHAATARAAHRGAELRLRPQARTDSAAPRRQAGRRRRRRRAPSAARRGDFVERAARGGRARVPHLSRPVAAGVPRRSRRDGPGRVSRRGVRRSAVRAAGRRVRRDVARRPPAPHPRAAVPERGRAHRGADAAPARRRRRDTCRGGKPNRGQGRRDRACARQRARSMPRPAPAAN